MGKNEREKLNKVRNDELIQKERVLGRLWSEKEERIMKKKSKEKEE